MSTITALLAEARRQGHIIGTANPTGHYPGLTTAAILCLCTILPEWTYRDLLTAWLHRRRVRGAFHAGWHEAVIAHQRAHPNRNHIRVMYRQVVGG